jgi:hypothetical protein
MASDERRRPRLIGIAWPDGGIILLLWLIVTAYNLFKPYHIDDAPHLAFAHWIAAHPLHPMSGMLNFGGISEPIWHFNQPPLYFYILGAWGSLFGYSEPAMHAMQSLFALAAIWLFHRMADKLVPAAALWLTALLALGPAFVVEQNLMVDVPLLSLWLLFFEPLIVGAEAAHQRRRFLIAAAACSAAILVKYSSLVLLPILFLVLVYERQWRLVWISCIPIVVIALWSAFNYFDYGHIHLAQRPVHMTRQSSLLPVLRFIALVVTLGAITPFGLTVAMQLVPAARRWAPAIYLAVSGASVLFVAAVAAGWLAGAPVELTLRSVFLTNGAVMGLGVVVVVSRRLLDRHRAFAPNQADGRLLILLLWIAGHCAFYSLFAPFMAVRHVLLVLPAILLVGAMLLPTRVPRADMRFALTTTIALSVMLGWADWRFAAFFRDEAIAIRPSLPPNARVWYFGGLGWLWYAGQAGMQMVTLDRPEFAAGDYLAVLHTGDQPPIPHPPPLVLQRTDSKPLTLGDLFCTADPVRFYATPFSDFTEGPWTLTRSCTNAVDIYRILSPG